MKYQKVRENRIPRIGKSKFNYKSMSSINKLLAIDKTISELKRDKRKNMCKTLALNLSYFTCETLEVLKLDKSGLHVYITMKLTSFSFNNARRYFGARKTKYGGLWWDKYDIDVRIKFLRFLRDRENNCQYKIKTKSEKELPEMKLFKETKQNSLLSERAIKLIQKLEVNTIEELASTPIDLMLKYRNVGATTISEIQKFIEVNNKR